MLSFVVMFVRPSLPRDCLLSFVGRALQQSGQEELANIARNILRQVEEFKPELPLLSSLLNPGMQDRHWQEISEAVGFPVRVGEHIKSLRDIDRLNLRSYLESINVISDKASKEHQLEGLQCLCCGIVAAGMLMSLPRLMLCSPCVLCYRSVQWP